MAGNPNAGTKMYYVRQSDGLAYCFSPVPFLAENIEVITKLKDGVQSRIGTLRSYTFNGTLLPEMPSLSGVNPDSTCLELLDRKSDQMKSALSEDRGNLLIVDSSGYPVLSIYPRVASIDFPDSQIVVKRDYQIVFEVEDDFEDGARVSDFSESWSFDYQEDDTIAASHSLSAVGIPNLPAGTGAIENAKYFVLQRANQLDSSQSSFLKSPFHQSIVSLSNLAAYNHFRNETIDETAGSYDIEETWVLASGAFKDDRTVETSYELNSLNQLVPTVSINGTVEGRGDTTFDRFNNAVVGFTSFVSPQIGFDSASGIVSKNRTDNRFAGTVSYSVSFGIADAIDAFESREVQRSFQRNEDGSVSQTVSTNAVIRPTSSSGIAAAIEFCFANNYPLDNYVEPFFNVAFSGNIESVSSERDDIKKSFGLTRVFRDQNKLNYREEYQVGREINVENAIITVSVNGTVQGISAESGTNSTVRFTYASGAFFNTIEPLIINRARELIPSGTCIGTNPIAKTLGINKLNGTLTYDYKYDNRFLTTNPNILDENISVDVQLPASIVIDIGIPEKPDGPILQDQRTVTGPGKTVRIQYRMRASGDTCGPVSTVIQSQLEDAALEESNILINNTKLQNTRGEKPIASGVFKVADGYTFDRRGLLFTRNTSWKYTNG